MPCGASGASMMTTCPKKPIASRMYFGVVALNWSSHRPGAMRRSVKATALAGHDVLPFAHHPQVLLRTGSCRVIARGVELCDPEIDRSLHRRRANAGGGAEDVSARSFNAEQHKPC